MKIALLTCEKLPQLYATDQLLIPELAQYNIDASAQIWDDPFVDWKQFDYLIFRNTWDYYEKEPQFNAWLDHLERTNVKTLNPLETIKQNKHKFYLRQLEKQGILILPTVFIDRTGDLDLSSLLPSGWKKAVIKPAFSGGSYQTEAFDSTETDRINDNYKTLAAQKELLLQEFRPEIQTLGETSLIFFDKKFSHAVNKKPMAGDFRVQVQFGGAYRLIEPSTHLIEQAQRVINTFPDSLLYARVDGIVMEDKLYLMEVECIEPDLYFNLCEGSQQRFVHAMLNLIANKKIN